MTERHKPMPTEMINDLLDISDCCPVMLTAFEKSIVNDRLTAIQSYGTNTVVTDKQYKILDKIIKKVKIFKRSKGVRLLE